MAHMMQKRLDNKHNVFAVVDDTTSALCVEVGIVKSTNGVKINLDKEPVILFRGRDNLAVPMLEHYRQLCANDGCSNYQLESIDDMIRRFKEFAATSPTIKQPGCTLGK